MLLVIRPGATSSVLACPLLLIRIRERGQGFYDEFMTAHPKSLLVFAVRRLNGNDNRKKMKEAKEDEEDI